MVKKGAASISRPVRCSFSSRGIFPMSFTTGPSSQPRVTSSAEPEPSAVASIVDGERPTTIIVSTPNSNDCKRYQLNVDTGARNDQGPVNCNADSSKQPGRLEAISKAFRNH